MTDILLLVLLGVGFVSGLISGAVKQVISLAAFVGGFVVACLYYEELAAVMAGLVQMPALCQAVSFLLLWAIVPLVARLVSALLTSLLDELLVMGGILGVAKYALVLGALIWFFSSAGMLKEETMRQSRLCVPLKAVPEFIYNCLSDKPSP